MPWKSGALRIDTAHFENVFGFRPSRTTVEPQNGSEPNTVTPRVHGIVTWHIMKLILLILKQVRVPRWIAMSLILTDLLYNYVQKLIGFEIELKCYSKELCLLFTEPAQFRIQQ